MSQIPVPHLPDVFEVAMLSPNGNGHHPIQMIEEPSQMVLVSMAEIDGQLPLFEPEEGQPSD